MDETEFVDLVNRLCSEPCEREWLEFKKDFHFNDEVGQRIAALSNSANLENREYAYLVFGIEDETHNILGANKIFSLHKIGNEDYQSWLSQHLNPRVDFRLYKNLYQGKSIAVFKIPAAPNIPVTFKKVAYIRVHNTTRSLHEYPEKERKIWAGNKLGLAFEGGIAIEGISGKDVLAMLNSKAYYEIMDEQYPKSDDEVLKRFDDERLIIKYDSEYAITNLGGLVFGNSLKEFPTLQRRAVRVVKYAGNNRSTIALQHTGVYGYAVGFLGLIEYVNKLIPENEIVSKAFRAKAKMYPEIAIRELIANAMFHQDFFELGVGPLIEIFSDRFEITNTGLPLLPTDRFIDSNLSRNPAISDLLQRLGICEELGRGWDRIMDAVEMAQLPPTDIVKGEKQTKVILFAHKSFAAMSKEERIRACFQHACLKRATLQRMNNQSLRERFGLDESHATQISKIISDTVKERLIKPFDPSNKSPRYNTYVPYWVETVD